VSLFLAGVHDYNLSMRPQTMTYNQTAIAALVYRFMHVLTTPPLRKSI